MDPAAIIRVSGRHSSKTKEALALELPDPRMAWDPLKVPTPSGNHVEIYYCFFLNSDVQGAKFLIAMSRDIQKRGATEFTHRGIPLFVCCGDHA